MTVTITSVERVTHQTPVGRIAYGTDRYVVATIDAPHWLCADVVESGRYVVQTYKYMGGRIEYTFRRTSDGSQVKGRADTLLCAALASYDAEEHRKSCIKECAEFVKMHSGTPLPEEL